jgi:hypothetical protein
MKGIAPMTRQELTEEEQRVVDDVVKRHRRPPWGFYVSVMIVSVGFTLAFLALHIF